MMTDEDGLSYLSLGGGGGGQGPCVVGVTTQGIGGGLGTTQGVGRGFGITHGVGGALGVITLLQLESSEQSLSPLFC